jgi:hypothetical protein
METLVYSCINHLAHNPGFPPLQIISRIQLT